MNTKKQNPYNSDTLQALLDIRTAIERSNSGLTDINDIIADMQGEKSTIRRDADQINHQHKFPDSSIGFSQTARYDQKALFYELPRGEQVLYNLMCDIQDPQSGYVTVIKGIYAKVLHFTDTESRNLQKYLDDLTEKGFLYCNYRPTNKKPGEYKINQGISWIGKRDKTQLTKLKEFQSKYTIGKDTVVLKDGTKVSSGKLTLLDLEEKKGASAGHTDPKTEPCTGSEPHDNSNRDTRKNQDSVIINMQKTEDLLSPAEEEFFSGTLKEREAHETGTNF